MSTTLLIFFQSVFLVLNFVFNLFLASFIFFFSSFVCVISHSIIVFLSCFFLPSCGFNFLLSSISLVPSGNDLCFPRNSVP